MSITKVIKQDGTGDFTTVQAFYDWVLATYPSGLPEHIIGSIQDSNTYNESVVPSTSIAPSAGARLILTSNQAFANRPTINGGAGQGIYLADIDYWVVEKVKVQSAIGGIYDYSTFPNLHGECRQIHFDGCSKGFREHYAGTKLYSCVFDQCIHGVYDTSYYASAVRSYNCLFYKCDYGIYQTQAEPHGYVYDYNCIFIIPDGKTAIYTHKNATDDIRSDFNVFYKLGTGYVVESRGGGDYPTLATWQAVHSQDLHSLDSDPRIVDGDSNDFRLQDDSPAKEAGDKFFELLGVDLLDNAFDLISPSMGAVQNLSVLTPAKCELVFPLGKVADSTPTFCWKVGILNRAGAVGTVQFTLALINQTITALLDGALADTDTTITFDNLEGSLPSTGTIILEDEIITYTGKTTTQLTGCTRGALGSKAVAHADDERFELVEAIKDSWATGANYDAALDWYFSSDYEERDRDPEGTGNWSALGTGNPGSTGVEGTNGVSPAVADAPRYSKVQLTFSFSNEYDVRVFAFNGVDV